MCLSKGILHWVIHHEVIHDNQQYRKAGSPNIVRNDLDPELAPGVVFFDLRHTPFPVISESIDMGLRLLPQGLDGVEEGDAMVVNPETPR